MNKLKVVACVATVDMEKNRFNIQNPLVLNLGNGLEVSDNLLRRQMKDAVNTKNEMVASENVRENNVKDMDILPKDERTLEERGNESIF